MSYTAGIDVGTGAVKVAVMSCDSSHPKGGELLATCVERMRKRDVASAVASAFDSALKQAGIERNQVDYIATTGEGDIVEWRTGHFYGMTTHSRGALFLDPEARGAIDIGALHTRAMKFNEKGRVLAYRMSSQCASGTGQFLENISRYLGVSIDEIGKLSLTADKPEKCSGICAVLAETDVINMVSRGISTPNILRGIHDSMAARLASLVRAIKIEGVVLLTGGLACDEGLAAAIRASLKDGSAGIEVRGHEHSILAGAIGAALWGAYRHEMLKAKTAAGV